MSRSRAPDTPSPVYPSCGAFTVLPSKVVLGIDSSSGEAAGG